MKAIVAGMLGVGLCLLVGAGCPDKSKEQAPVAVAPVQPAPQPYPETNVPPPEPQPKAAAEAPVPEPEEEAVDTSAAPKKSAKSATKRQAPKESYSAPRKAARTYTVKKGDTLQKISQKYYGTTKNWQKIYQANKKTIKDPDNLIVGDRLAIP